MKNNKTEKFTCDYCGKTYPVTPQRLITILESANDCDGRKQCSRCAKAQAQMEAMLLDADNFTDWGY